MSVILDSGCNAEGASLSSYYEEVLRVRLANIWRRKLLVIATVAGALVIGFVVALAIPNRYAADAIVQAYEGGFATNAVTPDGGTIALDASMVVETQARLLGSRQLALQVVQRIGLERLRPLLSKGRLSSWWHAIFYNSARPTPDYQDALAATRLLDELSIKTEPRVYLINVRYTAEDPEFAALITNTFVTEFLRMSRLKALSLQRDSAQRILGQLATLGERHPKVIEAKIRLEAANALLKAEENKTTDEISRGSGGNVTFAQAAPVPSSPNRRAIIGIALLGGLLGGIGIGALRGPS